PGHGLHANATTPPCQQPRSRCAGSGGPGRAVEARHLRSPATLNNRHRAIMWGDPRSTSLPGGSHNVRSDVARMIVSAYGSGANWADIACRRLAELSRSVTRHHWRVWQARCPTGQTRQLSPSARGDWRRAGTFAPTGRPAGRVSLVVVL